jgi:restriction endonuclease S subunit
MTSAQPDTNIGGTNGVRWMSARDCLEEITTGVGQRWKGLPVYGATRDGIALAKEPVGKYSERYKPVEPGTVFYNPMRILLGSIAMLDDGEPRGITSPDYVVVRGRPCILHHRVFYYWFRSGAGESLIRDLARGGVRERILFSRLAEGRIPVLPWNVQERLAEQLAIIPRARAAAQARLASAEALPAAYLREVFDGPEASEWEAPQLSDVADVQGGLAFKSKWFTVSGVRILRNANIHQGYINWEDAVYLPEARAGDFPLLILRAGDIVLSLDRPIVAAGLKAARLSPVDLPALLNQRVARFNLDCDKLDPDYFYSFLRSGVFIRGLPKHDHSLAVPHVSPAQVGEVPVPLPPLDQQRRIAADLALRLVEAERLTAVLREELATIDALPAALLREAFNGQA